MFTSYLIPGALSFVSAFTKRRACDREDASFDPVAYFDLFAAPTFKRVASSTRDET